MPYQLKYNIVNNKPKWRAENIDDTTAVTLYISPKADYLEIKDEGSGEATIKVQCLIIETKYDKSVIVLNTTILNPTTGNANSIKFFEVDQFAGFNIRNVLPKITVLDFIDKVDLAGQEDMFINGEVLYQINETNSKITAIAYFKNLEKNCKEGSKSACQAQNVIQPPLVLAWSKNLKKYIKPLKK